MTLFALARSVAMTPVVILRSTQTKFSVASAAALGLLAGARSRTLGQPPAVVIERVRREMLTTDGQLVEQESVREPTPLHAAANDALAPWLEAIPTAPDSWNTAIEQTLIVPMIRGILAVTELTAGVGYWLAGFVPSVVVEVGSVVLVATAALVYLVSLREVGE